MYLCAYLETTIWLRLSHSLACVNCGEMLPTYDHLPPLHVQTAQTISTLPSPIVQLSFPPQCLIASKRTAWTPLPPETAYLHGKVHQHLRTHIKHGIRYIWHARYVER